jgi:CRP-like cAMP-binding protein
VWCAVLNSDDSNSTRRFIQAGDEGNTLYLVIDGAVKVLANGKVTHLVKGDFFGEMSLIDGAPQLTSVVTETEMLAMQLECGPFVRRLASEPSVSLGIMKSWYPWRAVLKTGMAEVSCVAWATGP